MRWRLTDLFLFTLAAAIAFAVYRGFWDPTKTWGQWPNYNIIFGGYLAIIAVTSLGAIWGRNASRRFFAGCAFFCWLYLMLPLEFGRISSDGEGEWLARMSALGAAIGTICGIIAYWILPARPLPSQQPKNSQN